MALFDPNKKLPHEQPVFSVEEKPEVDAANIPNKLLVLPLRNTVIFPRTVVPVVVERPQTQEVVQLALETSSFVGAFKIKNSNSKEDLSPADLHSIGTACLILKVVPVGNKTLMVALQGVAKIEALGWEANNAVMRALVELVEEKEPQGKGREVLVKSLVNTAQKVVARSPYLPQEMGVLLEQLDDDKLKLLYTVATLIHLKPDGQQKLLELKRGEKKYRHLIKLLSRELEMLRLGGKIQSDVKKEFNKFQKEAFLRQRLKAIRKELGEEEPYQAEFKELEKRIKKAKLPEEAKKEAGRELKRLGNMHPMSGEYQVIRTYLDWILDLPWEKSSRDRLDLKRAKKVLDEDHYDLIEIKERLVEHLAVRKLRKDMKAPILCFVGPPGVGKTSLGKSIARALGRKFVRISLGGIRDEAEVKGHRRTYIGAMPGKIVQAIRRAETNNPVFMLDEVDKIGNDFRGDPSAALLEVLDPEQNANFRDHYLDLDFDLSRTIFIATANVLDTLHPALIDRLEIIEIPGYSDEEKLYIAEKFLLPRQIREHGLTKGKVRFAPEAVEKIISHYTCEAGVRGLEREIAKIIRKVAKKIATGEQKSAKISAQKVPEFLGPQKVFPESRRRVSSPGVATGLAVTPAGGEVLFIEATKMPGKKKFNLTGSLGEVMKESANAALSLVRSRAEELGIETDFFEKQDLHLHVPAGAVSKDGPSAGVAMVTSLASLLTGRKVKNDVAMTGEITLSGLVLPIGGVKQKVLAARRAGVTTVILPKKNSGELEEIEDHIKESLNFVLVEDIDQVLQEALLPVE